MPGGAAIRARGTVEQMQPSGVLILKPALLGRGNMEHRWGHRREVSRAVQLGTRGGVVARGRISNVSISGAFIVTPLPVPLFSYVQVQFIAMLNGKRTRVSVEGQIVRKEPLGVAIEWCELASEATRSLMMVPPFRISEPPHDERMLLHVLQTRTRQS